MGRWCGADKKLDLFAIKKSNPRTKATEIHVFCGDNKFQKAILSTDTALHKTDFCDFIVADWNENGRPDLVAVKKSNTNGKSTEVHALSGASVFEKFILRAKLPVFMSNGTFEFAVADWTGDEKPNLIGLKKRTTGTLSTEVHFMKERN